MLFIILSMNTAVIGIKCSLFSYITCLKINNVHKINIRQMVENARKTSLVEQCAQRYTGMNCTF